MEFFKLGNAKPVEKKKEFDAKDYIATRADKMSTPVDKYFMHEPIILLNSALLFDKVTDLEAIEMETSLLKQIKEFI